MKATEGIIRYNSRDDYINRYLKRRANLPKGPHPKKALEKGKNDLSSDLMGKKDQVEISDKARELSKQDDALKNLSISDSKSLAPLKNAVKLAQKIRVAPTKDLSIKEPKSVKEITPPENIPSPIEGPGVFFISGMNFFGIFSDENGLKGMAQNVPYAKHFYWDQEEEIVDIILKHDKKSPIIIVGHGFGGDAAVNIANELNTPKHGLRNIDLMVTIDSLGFNNDLIPQNVKKNLNFIGDQDLLFNDGPNLARNVEFTEVINQLVNDDHGGMVKSYEVQKKILDNIKGLI